MSQKQPNQPPATPRKPPPPPPLPPLKEPLPPPDTKPRHETEIDVTKLTSTSKLHDLNSGSRTQALTPHSPRGLKLQAMLKREFGIPDGARWFEIRFAINELVAVKCEFLPSRDEPRD